MEIRKGTRPDLPEIGDIYNHAILNLTATFDENIKSVLEFEEWLSFHQNPTYPLIVAMEDNIVLGWATISPLIPRTAARFTGETSIYIRDDMYGRGIGSKLLAALISKGEKQGYRSLVGLITNNNEASIKLHEKHGYKIVGRYEDAGYKFSKWLDLILMQKKLF